MCRSAAGAWDEREGPPRPSSAAFQPPGTTPRPSNAAAPAPSGPSPRHPRRREAASGAEAGAAAEEAASPSASSARANSACFSAARRGGSGGGSPGSATRALSSRIWPRADPDATGVGVEGAAPRRGAVVAPGARAEPPRPPRSRSLAASAPRASSPRPSVMPRGRRGSDDERACRPRSGRTPPDAARGDERTPTRRGEGSRAAESAGHARIERREEPGAAIERARECAKSRPPSTTVGGKILTKRAGRELRCCTRCARPTDESHVFGVVKSTARSRPRAFRDGSSSHRIIESPPSRPSPPRTPPGPARGRTRPRRVTRPAPSGPGGSSPRIRRLSAPSTSVPPRRAALSTCAA